MKRRVIDSARINVTGFTGALLIHDNGSMSIVGQATDKFVLPRIMAALVQLVGMAQNESPDKLLSDMISVYERMAA
jgi:hypothetical protein